MILTLARNLWFTEHLVLQTLLYSSQPYSCAPLVTMQGGETTARYTQSGRWSDGRPGIMELVALYVRIFFFRLLTYKWISLDTFLHLVLEQVWSSGFIDECMFMMLISN